MDEQVDSDRQVDEWMDGWIDRWWMGGWIDGGWKDGWIDGGWKDGWVGVGVGGQMDRWMSEQMDG